MATPRTATPSVPVANQRTDAQSVPAEAESSTGAAAADPTTAFAVGLSGYIFNAGFCHQQWADVQVSFFSTSLRLHRLVLARSPYLAHLLSNSMPGGSVQLLFTDENITEEAVYIAIQHLYNPSVHLVSSGNARAMLATAYLFGAMPDLEERAYACITESISSTNVADMVQWLGARIPSNGFSFGAVQMPASSSSTWGAAPALYGEWSVRLREDVVDFLLRALPAQLSAGEGTQPLQNDPRLMAAYVPLPYELFKQCIESPDLPIPFMQDRFAFAKRAIAQRKKLAQARAAGNPPSAQMEESVVLALKDDGDGMAVHVTRKPKRSRAALWKVEG